MSGPPPLPLAFLVRAVDRLRPRNAVERLAIARALGLLDTPRAVEPGPRPPQPPLRDDPWVDRQVRPTVPPVRQPAPGRAAARRTRLFAVESAGVANWPERLATAEPLSLDPDLSVNGPRTQPLLPAWAMRSVFVALLATSEQTGPVDVARVVTELGYGRPFRRVPRLPRLTLARGACALVDAGPTMAPFRDDVDALLRVLAETVGRSRLSVVTFETWPPSLAHAVHKRRSAWPPPPGEPIVVLSDIGLARTPAGVPRGEVAVWTDLARELSAHGTLLAALVPLLPAEVPDAVARRIAIVPLEERTTARTARRARDRAWTP